MDSEEEAREFVETELARRTSQLRESPTQEEVRAKVAEVFRLCAGNKDREDAFVEHFLRLVAQTYPPEEIFPEGVAYLKRLRAQKGQESTDSAKGT